MDLNLAAEVGTDADFLHFIRQVKQYTGIDLSLYKEQQMKRRLTTLRMKYEYATFAAFFEAMKHDHKLLDVFLDRMTINVSEFWRNPNRWTLLEDRFIPQLLAEKPGIKAWSAACSTGEEPYTLAMILAERGALAVSTILATDIDEGAIGKARAAAYPERSIRDVPERYRSQYFHTEYESFVVSDRLRRAVTFRKMNLLEDQFDVSFDLIICRNVLIYFTNEAKHMLYQKFADALRPGGLLFVGSTEQIFTPGQYGFESADTFFYRKI